jgi:Tfp pilus assembly protein PilO
MNLRGKEVYIITGVIIVVVAVAWFFLLYKPLSNKLSVADAQLTQTNQAYNTAKNVELPKLQSYQKTAPQTESDLLRLNKMMPSESGIPSVIVEITQTAQQSGLDFVSITPGGVVTGTPFGVETVSLVFTGRYYDLEDFLFRLESYVQSRNNAFLVTGRLLQVASVQLAAGSATDPTALAITVTLHAFLWTQPQSYSGGAALPQATPAAAVTSAAGSTTTATPTPGATSTASITPTPSVTPTPTGSTTP